MSKKDEIKGTILAPSIERGAADTLEAVLKTLIENGLEGATFNADSDEVKVTVRIDVEYL